MLFDDCSARRQISLYTSRRRFAACNAQALVVATGCEVEKATRGGQGWYASCLAGGSAPNAFVQRVLSTPASELPRMWVLARDFAAAADNADSLLAGKPVETQREVQALYLQARCLSLYFVGSPLDAFAGVLLGPDRAPPSVPCVALLCDSTQPPCLQAMYGDVNIARPGLVAGFFATSVSGAEWCGACRSPAAAYAAWLKEWVQRTTTP